MAVVLPLLLILLLGCHCLCSCVVAGDEHAGFTAAAACSGHSAAVIPPRKGTRVVVPFYRHLNPCSPASSSSTGAAPTKPASPPSLGELLRQDQLRADHIHRTLSSSSSFVRVSKQAAGPLKEPVRSELINLHNQPVIQVAIGSERKTSGGSGEQSESTGVVQTVVLDTASDVPWVQCHHPSPPSSSSSSYDPARSGTYTAMACSSPACLDLGRLYRGGCGANNQCQYRVPIPTMSSPAAASSSGTYGSDLLALAAADTAAGAMSFKFGCSHAESAGAGELDNATAVAGVMALGGGTESLVSQMAATYGTAFSYCIPAASDSRRRSGFFVLGSGGAAGATRTPMLRYARVPTYYRVRMVGIAVDGERLNVTAAVFAAGAVLDSRTAISRLPPTAYGTLREAFRRRMGMMNYREVSPPPGNGSQHQLDTCYDFSGAFFGFVTVPRIALIFDGDGDGAVVELDRSGVLFHDCLAFMATSDSDDRMAGVIGNVQQQTMEVIYDVGGGSVGFRRGAC